MKPATFHRAGMLALFLMLSLPMAAADEEIVSLYQKRCAACHAADGSGSTAAGKKTGARDFRSPEVVSQSDAELAKITAEGKNKMPAFGKSLNRDQINALVGYVRGLAKAK
jgi:mono/diheme cytochrome c family protein